MKRKTISKEAWEKACAERGIEKAAPDDPIYSEPAWIILSSHSQKPSQQKVIDSHQNDTPKDSN